VEDFMNEPCTKELHDLLVNRLALLVVEAVKVLFNRFRSRLDV
jgi:23S rRNA maturation-related 3'-5' exoribonuclease YhaM